MKLKYNNIIYCRRRKLQKVMFSNQRKFSGKFPKNELLGSLTGIVDIKTQACVYLIKAYYLAYT